MFYGLSRCLSEMIYNVYATKINPSDYNRVPFKKRFQRWIQSPDQAKYYGEQCIKFMNLYRDIEKNGIKYPVLVESVKGKASIVIGHQRAAIADNLKLDLIDAVVFSTNGKVELNGLPIKELNDIVKIYGKSIIGEPVFDGIIQAIKRTYKHNSSSIG